MKILLLNSPINEGEASVPPLGICYIAAVLRKKFEVKLIDLDLEKKEFKNLRKILDSFNPDVLMISSLTPQIENAYTLAQIVKDYNKKIVVIVGGPHPSALPKRTLEECPEIDIVVVGEGENISLKICEKILIDTNFLENIEDDLKNIDNIYFRHNENILSTNQQKDFVDVNSLPFPARDLLKFDRYPGWGPKKGDPSTHIIASRGCPFDCVFCSEKVVFGRGNRRRSAQDVVNEIEHLKKEYHIKEFSFYDDLFTANKEWVKEICEEIIKRKINLPWKALSRVDTIDLETLKLMKRAGCWLIFYGYESGSNEILRNINKMTTIEQGLTATELTKQAGIKIFGFFMLGNIGETRETIKQTIEYAQKIGPDYFQFAIVRPDPGSPQYFMYQQELEKKHITWNDYYAFHKTSEAKLPLVGTNLTLEELIRYKEIATFVLSKKHLLFNFAKNLCLNPGTVLDKIKKIYLPSLNKKFN